MKLAFFPSIIPLPKLNSPEAGTREQKEKAIGKALYFWLNEWEIEHLILLGNVKNPPPFSLLFSLFFFTPESKQSHCGSSI